MRLVHVRGYDEDRLGSSDASPCWVGPRLPCHLALKVQFDSVPKLRRQRAQTVRRIGSEPDAIDIPLVRGPSRRGTRCASAKPCRFSPLTRFSTEAAYPHSQIS